MGANIGNALLEQLFLFANSTKKPRNQVEDGFNGGATLPQEGRNIAFTLDKSTISLSVASCSPAQRRSYQNHTLFCPLANTSRFGVSIITTEGIRL